MGYVDATFYVFNQYYDSLLYNLRYLQRDLIAVWPELRSNFYAYLPNIFTVWICSNCLAFILVEVRIISRLVAYFQARGGCLEEILFQFIDDSRIALETDWVKRRFQKYFKAILFMIAMIGCTYEYTKWFARTRSHRYPTCFFCLDL
eukprot:76269_1